MFQDNLFRELVVDNFAGGGGASTGMELALGYPVDIAVNHDADAIAMHKVNHPYTRHFREDVFAIDPERVTGGRAVGIAWFSPDCKHFSRAKGGKPVDKKIRGLSWVVLKWAMHPTASSRIIMMENVEEIQTWGPLIEVDGKMRPDPSRSGETFNGFIAMLTTGIDKSHPAFSEACEFLKIGPNSEEGDRLAAGLDYKVEWRTLKACDYGAPTIRKRFYLIARRDGFPIVWPAPTHGRGKGLKRYRTAAECIDWNIPCPSIFERTKPLAENTLRRIARGLDKFVIRNKRPYIVSNNTNNVPHDVKEPLPTVTTGNRNFLCAPSLVQYHSEQGNGEVRGQGINKPIMTIDGSPRYAVNAAFLSKYFSGAKQNGAALNEPMPTVTAIDHSALTTANIVKYYGGDEQVSAIDEPLHTVTTKDRHGLVESHLCVLRKNTDCKDMRFPMPTLTTSAGHMAQTNTYLAKAEGQDFGHWSEVRALLNAYAGYNIREDEVLLFEICGQFYFIRDIGLRMLKAKELMLAQGFPPDYVIDIEPYIGKKYCEAKQVARLGNAVCPPVAEALVRANCAEIASQRVIATMAMLNAVIDESCHRKRQYRRAAHAPQNWEQ